MILDGRKITTLVMLILFSGACLLALELPTKAAFMPLLVGVPGVLLCLAQLVIDFRAGAKEDEDDGVKHDEASGKTELEVFLWLGLFTFALVGFGFVVGGPIIVGAFVRFSSRETWLSALFAAAGTFAVLYGVFIWMLELSLFHGLILEKIWP